MIMSKNNVHNDWNGEIQERSEEQIYAELAATRAQMTQTVNELYARVQPEYIAEHTKKAAARKVQELKAQVKSTVEDAQAGDPEALKKVGIAALSVGALIAVAVFTFTRKKR